MELLRASRSPADGWGRGLIDLGIGLIAGGVVMAGFAFDPNLGILVAMLIVGVPLLILRPASLFWMAVLAVLVFEEFPSGLGEGAERAQRNAFYAQSIVVPGLYMPDLLLIAAIGLAVLGLLIERRRPDLCGDRTAVWMVLMSMVMVISVGGAFVRGNPLDYGGIQSSIGFGFEINERSASLIAFFQIKNFILLMLAYLATLLYVRDRSGLDRCLRVLGVAAGLYLLIGLTRLATHPDWVAQTIPLFYDSLSSLLFVLIAYYVVAAWSQGLLSRSQTLWMSVLAGFMMLFVLVSFRRTMWGAAVLALLPLLAFMPASRRNYLLIGGSAAALVMGGAILLSPVGEAVLAAVAARLGETSEEDQSTAYRMVLFRYFATHYSEIPLFGHGPRPLWNEMVTVKQFRISLENVHSLYFWIWLRLGHAGLVVFITGMIGIMAQAWSLSRRAADPRFRVVALMVLLGTLMFLFSGIFNPVYSQPRYVITLGLGLGLLSRMMQWDRSGRVNT